MSEHNILGAILAGGQSKRMGKDKLFLELNNKKLIEHTINKVKKYLKKVIIITNQDNEFFSKKKKPFSQASLIIKADFGLDVLNNFVFNSSTDIVFSDL